MISTENWSDVKLFFSGDDYFDDVLRSLQSAVDEIRIEVYIFSIDPIGERVLHALKAAAQRGVKVYLLVDAIGSLRFLIPLREFCAIHHIHFKIYHPLPVRLNTLKRITWTRLRRSLWLLKKMNKRNHRKIFLIDRKLAFLGSLNVTQIHSESFAPFKAWRDTGLRLKGKPLIGLRKACLQDWGKSRSEGLSYSFNFKWKGIAPDFNVLKLNSNHFFRRKHFRELMYRLRNAREKIFITTPYFLPRYRIIHELKAAAKRGVEVVVCLPALSDMFIVRWASKILYATLIKAGVEIYEYQNRNMHAKTLIIDEWAIVGSANLNYRSLFHDLEVQAVLNKPEWQRPLLEQWQIDLNNSKEVTLEDLGRVSWYSKVFSNIFYKFRYWL